MTKPKLPVNELLNLMNVGKATYQDLQLLEVKSIAELAKACPDESMLDCKVLPINPMIPVSGMFLLLQFMRLVLAKKSIGASGQKCARKNE